MLARVSVSAAEFKATLSRWASGVSIVTSRAGERPVGLTVSAFFSASLEPPLIAVCLDRKAQTLPAILDSGYFAINVLSSEQRALSDRFATKHNEDVRFDGVALLELPDARSPLLAGAVAHLDCRLHMTQDVGDHALCVGEVLLTMTSDVNPLSFFRGSYHGLTPLGR